MVSVLKARKHSNADAAPATSSAWEMTVVGRQGKPPLRFKGRQHTHMRRQTTGLEALRIDLWARQRGGFVLAYSDVLADSLQPDALICPKLSDVVAHLEEVCADHQISHRYFDLPSALAQVLQTLGQQQAFAILVGDFLSAIDAADARAPSVHP